MTKTTRIRASALCVTVLLGTGCGANEGVLRSGNETPVQANAIDEKPQFERDLNAMHTAGFTFVYVLRRRDGKTIDSEDIRTIKELTADTNRRVKSDSDRAVLIGSNFEVPKENFSALNSRFLVEDHSKPRVSNANINSNSNK